MNDGGALFLSFIGFFWIVPIIAGGMMAYDKGRSRGAGITLGILLGWIGVLIVACWNKDHVELESRKRWQVRS